MLKAMIFYLGPRERLAPLSLPLLLLPTLPRLPELELFEEFELLQFELELEF